MSNTAPELHNGKNLDTVVIPVAGLGTRMYPFSAEVPKFMTPVVDGNRAVPSIDFTLQDCLVGGVKNFIFVYSRDGKDMLERYLGPVDPAVEYAMKDLGKEKDLDSEKERRAAFSSRNGVNLEFVEQPLSGGKYGTTIPVALAAQRARALEGVTHFAVYGGDSFVYRTDGRSEFAEMKQAWLESGAEHAIMGSPVSRETASNFGILQQEDGMLVHIDEKPPLVRVPAHPLANAIGYMLNSSILEFVGEDLIRPRPQGQREYYFTDVVNSAVDAGHSFRVHEVGGAYLDAGVPQTLHATNTYINQT